MKCELEIDLNFYCKTYYSATEDDPDKGDKDESEEMDPKELIITDDTYDLTSLNSVLGRLPVFLSTKSMLEEIVSKSGHILLLSSKYHAEVAGQGIEYCFGRTKWWFKKNNSCSTAALKRLSKEAFGLEVVRIDHVRKFARKSRDYQRVYRAGVTGLAAESSVKQCKTHRCMGDTNHTFITE